MPSLHVQLLSARFGNPICLSPESSSVLCVLSPQPNILRPLRLSHNTLIILLSTITILFALTHCTISLSNRGAYPDSELFARAGTTFVIVVHLKSPAPHRCRCYVGLLHPALAPFFLPLLLPRSYSKSPTCARALISPIGSQSDTIEVHVHV